MSVFGGKIKSTSAPVSSPLAKKIAEMKHVRWACRVIVFLVTGVSVAGNSINANWNDGWSVFADTLPPLLVFVGFEIMTRAPLRAGKWYSLKRAFRPLAALIITFISMFLSYFNQKVALTAHTNQHTIAGQLTPWLLPVAIDCTMIIAMITLVDLNVSIKELQAVEAVNTAAEVRRSENPAPVQRRKSTKSERVARHLDKYPEDTDTAVAKKLGVSLSLVGSVRKKIKDAAAVAVAA